MRTEVHPRWPLRATTGNKANTDAARTRVHRRRLFAANIVRIAKSLAELRPQDLGYGIANEPWVG